jgi:hypothetical protein
LSDKQKGRVWVGINHDAAKIVNVLSPDYALADRTSVWRVTYENDSIWRFNHVCSCVFKKGTSGWKFIHYHESLEDIR